MLNPPQLERRSMGFIEIIQSDICWTPARLGRRARREMNADPFNFAIMVWLHPENSSGKNISTV